ncbi:Hypothetical protein NTJ_02464 [Nesidiocoris tenuis]|uniref:Uncharacterized protein n=1 Tax=Nesidiocoris tenuis TaxID=355587 RepID=A0ABN7AEH9_9HEMI|nr:Hypothetical protein NTJ_02464 [Nesidiocoris tenuis]
MSELDKVRAQTNGGRGGERWRGARRDPRSVWRCGRRYPPGPRGRGLPQAPPISPAPSTLFPFLFTWIFSTIRVLSPYFSGAEC